MLALAGEKPSLSRSSANPEMILLSSTAVMYHPFQHVSLITLSFVSLSGGTVVQKQRVSAV